jgi:uncharacterized BrkB/YihY/UPF0761 family membrane protein
MIDSTAQIPDAAVAAANLQAEVNRYVRKGFRVTSQTLTSAQLTKRKKFSFLFAILWLLVAGVGILVYLLYYAAKQDKQVYLTVDAAGKVTKR